MCYSFQYEIHVWRGNPELSVSWELRDNSLVMACSGHYINSAFHYYQALPFHGKPDEMNVGKIRGAATLQSNHSPFRADVMIVTTLQP